MAFIWVKQNRRNDDLFTGMGYWTRANAEICILATKGHPKRVDAGVRQVILSHIEEHSKKPDEARERIVRLIDRHEVGGHSFYLMEHDAYGDEAACIIVDERGKLVLDDVYNGFDDDTLRLLDLEVKEVPEMPDPALSVKDMKDYGYAWAGVLPAGQDAAEKAMEKGCEVYRLYSDNTEGLCVDAKEIADHAAKGGMLGISKESWMAALEKENYLKAAEMSMEDDYGMIDGIINNGPKEDKTLDVKAPETGEKSSIMDRLKSAKAEKQKECCPPKKHKGEIEL